MNQAKKIAYYQITVTPTGGKTLCAVRELEMDDLDHLWNLYEMRATGVYRNLDYFNLVLLSRYSREVIEYEKKKNQYGHPPEIDIMKSRKPKREQKDPGPTLLERMRNSQRPPYQEGTDPDRA